MNIKEIPFRKSNLRETIEADPYDSESLFLPG